MEKVDKSVDVPEDPPRRDGLGTWDGLCDSTGSLRGSGNCLSTRLTGCPSATIKSHPQPPRVKVPAS